MGKGQWGQLTLERCFRVVLPAKQLAPLVRRVLAANGEPLRPPSACSGVSPPPSIRPPSVDPKARKQTGRAFDELSCLLLTVEDLLFPRLEFVARDDTLIE